MTDLRQQISSALKDFETYPVPEVLRDVVDEVNFPQIRFFGGGGLWWRRGSSGGPLAFCRLMPCGLFAQPEQTPRSRGYRHSKDPVARQTGSPQKRALAHRAVQHGSEGENAVSDGGNAFGLE
jgi:hypothetical protein